MWVLGTEPWSSGTAASALPSEPPLQPLQLPFLVFPLKVLVTWAKEWWFIILAVF